MALLSAGADPTMLADRRGEFDAALAAAPAMSTMDPQQRALREALGVA